MQYKDLLGTAKNISFAEPPDRPKTSKMEETQEGFLICRDVVLARTGEQVYGHWEVPLEPGPNGMVTALRDEAEVFHPDTIASFNGKPFTNDHPLDDVGPGNFKDHLVGVVMNPRRGTGDHNHCLVGDVIVYDARAIRDIKSGKRQVSCGYDADYERVAPGKGRQINIRGNHVSLVKEGRCGPTCSISDRKTHMAKVNGKNGAFMDALRGLLKAKDDGEDIEKHLEGVAKALPDDTQHVEEKGDDDGEGGESNHHVTVNIGGLEHNDAAPPRQARDAKGKARDEDGEEYPDEGDDNSDEGDSGPVTKDDLVAALAPIADAMSGLAQRVEALEGAVEDVSDPSDTATQDAIARAEVLVPGFKLPTMDTKPGSKAHRDALKGLKAKVLQDAFMTKDGHEAISPLVSSARPDFSRMTADALDVIFRAASQRVADMNNQRSAPAFSFQSAGYVKDANGNKKVLDGRDLNEINRKYWGRDKQPGMSTGTGRA